MKTSKMREILLPSVIITFLGIALSIFSYFAVSYQEEKKFKADVKAMTWQYIAVIEKEVAASLQVIQSIVSFQTASLNIEREEFQKFVREPLREHKNIYAVQMIRRVAIPARTAYEESMKGDAQSAPFHIRELNIENLLVPAGRRSEYYPVHYVEPLESNEDLIGFDHASEPERFDLMQRARNEGKLLISGPVALTPFEINGNHSEGFFAFSPIYQNDVSVLNESDRKQYLVGFISGVFRYRDIIDNALGREGSRGLYFQISDVTNPDDEKPFYSYPLIRQNSQDYIKDFEYESVFQIAGRSWRIVGSPSPSFWTTKYSSMPMVVSLFLLFLTALLLIYFISIKRHSSELADLNSELDQANSMLKELVTIDPLTGLLNRRGLHQLLFETMTQWQRSGENFHVIMLDLDNFKSVNDTLGFVVGDLILKEVAKKVKASLRSTDRVVRIGGDEFVVILPGIRHAEAMVVAQKIRFQIAQMTVTLSTGKNVRATASIGVTPLAGDEISVDQVVEKAYLALHESKLSGKNRVVFSRQDGEEPSNESDQMITSVLNVLREGLNFYAVLQPIHRLSDHVTVGYEFLSRLQHQDFKLPNDFFHIALEAKILTLVDLACLRTCLAASRALRHGMKVHVNIFPSTLIETPTSQLVEEFQKSNGVHSVCLEISEQQIVGDPDHIVKQTSILKKAGISISMDDVGFGSSSLESLILLEPEIVKIDRRCVSNISEDPAKIRSLERLLRVVESCNAEAYAEGIESEKDLEVLESLGVQYGQGFYIGKPAVQPVG